MSDIYAPLYISSLYVGLFGRIPDPEGFRYWKNLAEQEHVSPHDLVFHFIEGPGKIEFDASFQQKIFGDQLDLLYTRLFNRGVDFGGFAFWLSQKENGQPLWRIFQGIFDAAWQQGLLSLDWRILFNKSIIAAGISERLDEPLEIAKWQEIDREFRHLIQNIGSDVRQTSAVLRGLQGQIDGYLGRSPSEGDLLPNEREWLAGVMSSDDAAPSPPADAPSNSQEDVVDPDPPPPSTTLIVLSAPFHTLTGLGIAGGATASALDNVIIATKEQADHNSSVIDGSGGYNTLIITNDAAGLDMADQDTPVANISEIRLQSGSNGLAIIPSLAGLSVILSAPAQLRLGAVPNQTVVGSAGDDIVHISASSQQVLAHGGADVILAGAFSSLTIDGGGGLDTLRLSGATVDLTTWNVTAVEVLDINGANPILPTALFNSFVTVNDSAPIGNDISFSNNGSVTHGSGSARRFVLHNAGQSFIGAASGAGYTIQGGAGNDLIQTGGGDDSVSAGGGHDTIIYVGGDDTLDGGGGTDVLRLLANFGSVSDGQLQNIEEVVLGVANLAVSLAGQGEGFTVQGSAGADSVEGGTGADWIKGGDGDDTIKGGGGNDTIEGGDGDDRIVYATGDGADSIDGGPGTDRLLVSGSYTPASDGHLVGVERVELTGPGTLSLANQSEDLQLFDSSGNDSIVAGSGNDTIRYSGGTDTINGGGGTDVLLVETALYNPATNALLVNVEEIHLASAATVTLSSQTESFTIRGSDGNDSITGGQNTDVIYGGDGDDTIQGGSGNDTIYAENGNDVILYSSGGGVDSIDGGDGTDTLRISVSFTPASDDHVRHIEVVQAVASSLAINLSNQSEGFTIIGSAGADTIHGSAGPDHIRPAGGNDSVFGNQGDDTFYYEASGGSDTIDGGDGLDTLRVFANYNPSSDAQLVNVERIQIEGALALSLASQSDGFSIFGSDGNDTITGSTGDDLIVSGDGDDTITVSGGVDTINGGLGIDTLRVPVSATYSLSANDFLDGVEHIVLLGSASVDLSTQNEAFSITGSSGADTITGGSGHDTILGGGGNDSVQGGEGNDSLLGGAGNDTIDGGAGDDTIDGGTGNDSLFGGDGDDVFLYNASGGADTIDGGSGFNTIKIYANFNPSVGTVNNIQLVRLENAVQVLLNNLNGPFSIIGSSGNDSIRGSQGHDTIQGGEGNDTIDGGVGDDSIDAGDGNDLIFYSGGSDTIDGGSGSDTLRITVASYTPGDDDHLVNVETIVLNVGAYVNLSNQTEGFYITGSGAVDTIEGGQGEDTIEGGGGNDVLYGGLGNDSLHGGTGNDRLWGGGGSDTLTGGSGNDQFRYASASEGNDVITDFEGNIDRIAIHQDFINFPNTNATAAGTILSSLDYQQSPSIIIISDMTPANAHQKVVEIQYALSQNDIFTGATSSVVKSLVLVFNTDTNRAEVWYDDDWSSVDGRVLLVGLQNITTLAQMQAFTQNSFMEFL